MPKSTFTTENLEEQPGSETNYQIPKLLGRKTIILFPPVFKKSRQKVTKLNIKNTHDKRY